MEGEHTWDSFTYLGVPIFKGVPKVDQWYPILEKFKARIHNWGANWLNLVGKTVLLKSVLLSSLIY